MTKKKYSSRNERLVGGRTAEDHAVQQTPVHNDDKVGIENNSSRIASHSNDDITRHGDLPLRDTNSLFASGETIGCATLNHCVPCAYKIGLFDVAMDKEFCQKVPNQRPEQCPRLVTKAVETTTSDESASIVRIHPMGYQPGMSILTVGDGDFSFSLALARILFAPRTINETSDLPVSSMLVATSYETEETLRKVYDNFDETMQELHRLGATTLFQVDATRLNQTLFRQEEAEPVTKTSLPQSELLFHRICWNFPCTAIAKGQDGQNQEMEANKQLVREFVASARPFLVEEEDCGEIHICHKTKPPFNQWKLEQVVVEGTSFIERETPGSSPSLFYAGRMVLDRALLPPYIPRKALDRKSFPCHDACFYIFQSRRTPPSTEKTSSMRFEPTLPLLRDDDEKDSSKNACSSKTDNNQAINNYPLPVTPSLILSLRIRCIRAQAKRNLKSKASRYSGGNGRKRQRR